MVAYWRSFIVSILIHIMLAIALVVAIHHSEPGNQAQRIVNAYLLMPTSGLDSHPRQKKVVSTRYTPVAHEKVVKHHALKHRSVEHEKAVKQHALTHIKKITKLAIKPQHQVQQASHRLSPKAYSLLIDKLHDAIAANLIYPNQAVFLNETGVTYLSFILEPSGEIKSIKIKASSHSPILDKAAVDTLNKISPFIEAKKLLSNPQHFTIPIRFQL
jgi:TonB family protein